MNTDAFNKKTILEYWCRYFPELNEGELDEIIGFMGEIDYQTLVDEYERYDEYENNEVEKLVDFDYCELICKYKDWFENQQIFSAYIFPIVNHQLKKWMKKQDKNEILHDRDLFWKNIIVNINFKVYQILYKSIIFEISYMKKKNQLIGETPEERMEYFLFSYMADNRNIINFYKEYYTITKLAIGIVESGFMYVTEILENIQKNKTALEKTFGTGDISGGLRTISLGQGDMHQGGKSVAFIEFVNGVKILYKPHGMEIDNQFEKLMQWLKVNITGLHDYIMPKIICTKEYGFSEFIQYKKCQDIKEVEKFYERTGELLAVLYSLNSSDLHYENIIAYGEYPVLIDLETLIHPTINNLESPERNSALKKAEKKYNNSVATIGMLPTYMKGNLEVGGLGAQKEQNSTFKTEFVEDAKSDSIRIVRKYFKLKPEQNNPVVDGKTVDSAKYIEEIKTGFSRVYHWINGNKEVYIKYIVDTFTGCTGRIIIRPTLYYAQLLNISLHQEFARKTNERRLILYRVAQEQYKDFPDIVKAEYSDLMQGNIPYFTYRIGRRDILTSKGKILEKTKITPFIQEIREKITEFSIPDLHEQLHYIEDSYITRRNQADRTYLNWSFYENKLQTDKWLETAISIGEYIGEKAIEGINARGEKDAAWICVTLQGFEEDVWIPSVLGQDFYSGNAGIAYYFTYLWKITKKRYFLESARKAAEAPLTLLDRRYVNKNSSLGAFIGISGTIYMLNSLAEATQDAVLKRKGEDALISFMDLLLYDKGNDVISGLAGYLAVALRLAKTSERKEEFDTLITRIAEQLIQNAVNDGDKVYWNCLNGKHYSGFSHGNAGIHTYLYLAMKHLKERKFEGIVQRSINYERCCFSKRDGSWLRSDRERGVSDAWCHGAPGILLSKLILYNAGMTDTSIKKEVEIALNRTRQYGFGNNPTYCHGDLGNMAILNYAGKVFGRSELCNENMHVFQQLYQQILAKEWRNREFKSCNTYGLMVGLSGWGYSMLSHYAAPEYDIPEFLWME